MAGILFTCHSDIIARTGAENSFVENSIIIIIHGDGDYLFHDKGGNPYSADETALHKSLAAAAKLRNSEVFIFHQKKREHSFLFFPEDDLDLYYLREGRLLNKQTLIRTNFNFEEEINFYNKYSSTGIKNILIYYGHEIPVDEGFGYNSSNRNTQFNISIFTDAAKRFSSGRKFDLVVLSTCNNGSPPEINMLSSVSEYIIASPTDLHLSYLNPLYLKKLNYYGNDFEYFVIDFAKLSFKELKDNVETVSTVSVYKTELLSKKFLNDQGIENIIRNNKFSLIENYDCAENDNFTPDEAADGVIVFYNAPSFGRDKFKLEHSGWGCRKETEFKPASAIEKVIRAQKINGE